MKRLLLIAALALMSGACASARPEYYLVPPVSVVAPVVSEVTTPRPPAPEETVIVIDEVEVAWPPGMEPEATPRPPLPVSASNNLKGKLNKQPTPVSVRAPSAQKLPPKEEAKYQEQINSLLAQIDSSQNAGNNVRQSKLERYARELATTRAELESTRLTKVAAEEEIERLKRYIQTTVVEKARLEASLATVRRGFLQWHVISWNEFRAERADRREWIFDGSVSLILLLALALFLGYRRGLSIGKEDSSDHIAAFGDAIKARSLHIKELRKENTELKVKLERRRVRIHVLKRQRAGPLPETVDDDPPLGEDEPPDSVFGPLEREEREE